MAEKTCGGCKHWGPPEANEHGHGTCGRVLNDCHSQIDSEYAKSMFGDDDPPESAVHAISAAYVSDGEGYYAALRCREDFGCVLHEPKP